MTSLAGKTALITGAGSGIGRAMAQAFARAGARVIVHDVDPNAQAVADESGGIFLQADLSSMNDARGLGREAVSRAGGRIDVLVNNAGFQSISAVEEFAEDKWAEMIQVMLIAPFQLTQAVVPGMKAAGWGRIINVSSVHGLVASPFKSAYVSAKHGLIGFTKTIALELAEFGITANAICPAYVRTAIVEKQIADLARAQGIAEDEVIDKIMLAPAAIKRLIEPWEIAEFSLYLASDKAACITGASHALDLGWTAR